MTRVVILLSAISVAAAAGHFSDGMKAFEKKDFETARQCFSKILEDKDAGPLVDDALYWSARSFEAQDKKKEAREGYLQLLRRFRRSEYFDDALDRFVGIGGKRVELSDRSTPEKLWESFCGAVVEKDSECLLSCLGGEMKKVLKIMLGSDDADSFWAEGFSEITRTKTVKVEKEGEKQAVLSLSLKVGGGGQQVQKLSLVKEGSGWVIVDTVEKARRAAPPPVHVPMPMEVRGIGPGRAPGFRLDGALVRPPGGEEGKEDKTAVSWPEKNLTADEKAELVKLIRLLSSDSFAERERATSRIIEMGPAAGREIEELLEAPDPEVRFRARKIRAELSKTLSGKSE